MTDEDSPSGPGNPGSPDPLGIIGWELAGKYRITAFIQEGGFGYVYEARNVSLERQRLAVKIFKRERAGQDLIREAETAVQLNHPNICSVVDYQPEHSALVMHFIEGPTAAQLLEAKGRLPEETLLRIARAVLSAVSYAHQERIAHRDIKPGNIMVDENDHVFLIDFGIAKETGTATTATAQRAFTQLFAAPERQTGRPDYDPFLSDIFELAVTLFNLATGQMPYRNPIFPSVDDWDDGPCKQLSPTLRRILAKAAHPDPAQRYSSMEEFARDFENVRKVYSDAGWKKHLLIGLLAVFAIVLFFTVREFWPLPGPDTPELLGPAADSELAAGSEIVFLWSATAGDSGSYVLEIGRDEEVKAPFLSETMTIPVDTITPGLDSGTYYWRARAVDKLGSTGGFSKSRRLQVVVPQVSPPRLYAPDDGTSFQSGTGPRLTWSNVAGEGGTYELCYDSVADFGNQQIRSLEDTSCEFPGSAHPGRSYWRVRARTARGDYSDYSETRSLSIQPEQTGILIVTAACYCDVYLDGQRQATRTKSATLTTRTGQHRLMIKAAYPPGETLVNKRIDVESKDTLREGPIRCLVEIFVQAYELDGTPIRGSMLLIDSAQEEEAGIYRAVAAGLHTLSVRTPDGRTMSKKYSVDGRMKILIYFESRTDGTLYTDSTFYEEGPRDK